MEPYPSLILRIIAVAVLIQLYTNSYSQQLRTTVQSGNWSNRNTWDCSCVPAPTDHAFVVSGHTVTFLATNSITDLTIEAGAILTDNGHTNTISGNLLLNGTYSGSGFIHLTGENTFLDGIGTISNTAAIQVTGNKTIAASAQLTVNSSDLIIQGDYTITHYGTFTIGGNIIGSVASSTWTNEAHAVLNVGGSSGIPLLATGTLNAYADGNVVNYYATYAHTLKLPTEVLGYSTYHHLVISGANTKTLPNGDVAVNGDLTIYSTFSGSGSSKKLFLRGNWINYGNFTEGTGLGTVTFDGTTDQILYRAATENLNVLVVNKPTGKLILQTPVIAERGLTLISGDIDTQTHKLTLGLSATVTGTFSRTSGTIIGKFERWISSAGVPVLFPIGTATDYRAATIYFHSLTPGSLIAEFISDSPGQHGLPIDDSGVNLYNTFRDGYWSLTAANSLDTVDFNLDLTGEGFTGFVINDNTRLLTRASSIDPWSSHGIHLARVDNTIRRINLTTLSGEFCFGDDTNCTAPLPTGITGTTDVCTNSSEVYSVMNIPPNTYEWHVTGGTITSGNGTHSIAVTWGPSGMSGLVTVVERNSCTAGEEITLTVNIHALSPTSLTGKTNVPENSVAVETYSVPALTDYTYTWTVTGGMISSGQGTPSITVNWGSSGAGSVCVAGNHTPVFPATSCGQSISLCETITIYRVINSIRSGNWQTPANWDCSCAPGPASNVTIHNTHTISLTGARTVNHVNINAGGAINTNTNPLTITGDLAVHGILRGTGSLTLSGAHTLIDGIGTITNTGVLHITAGKTILSTASLTKTDGVTTIGSGVVVTNTGTITLGGSLDGIDMNSHWINSTGSTLNIGGELLSTGKLYAASDGNTVRYFGSVPQAIANPDDGQYHHLFLSGTGEKTAPSETLKVSGNFLNDGLFQPNSGTIEFNGSSQLMGSAITPFHHVVLASASTLIFPSGMVPISGNMDFKSGSTFEPAGGTVLLQGSAPQHIDVRGAHFNVLEINKIAGVVNLSSEARILDRLHLQTPTVLHTHDHLVIRSRGVTTDLDAAIGPLPAINLIQGAVTVERFMNAIGKTYRYVASPVLGALPPAALGSALYHYTYSAGAGSWKTHSTTSPLANSKGYTALMTANMNPVTWSVKGAIRQGAFTWNLNEEGWHLLGNPYPSLIRWFDNPQAWSLNNIATTIAVTDNSVSGYPNYFRYWSYDDENNPEDWGAGELQNGVVAMGQAFWVYVGEGGGSLTVHEPAKEPGLGGRFYRTASSNAAKVLSITLENGKFADRAFLKLNPKTTQQYEFNHDLKKLWNPDLNVYLQDFQEHELVISSIDQLEAGDRIPVGFDVAEAGTYRLTFTMHHQFTYFNDLYLIDVREGRAIPVSDGTYTFTLSEGSTSSNSRFYLSLRNELPSGKLAEVINLYPNPVADKLFVQIPADLAGTLQFLDLQGKELFSSEFKGSFELDVLHRPKGVYVLRLVVNGEVMVYKVVH